MVKLPRAILVLVAMLCCIVACAHLNAGVPGPLPTPSGGHPSPSPLTSPSGGPSGSPGPCASPAFGTTTVFVVMSFGIAPTAAPGFGEINGYIAANADGTFNNVAQPITVHPTDVIQFANVDNSLPTTIFHSAVGLGHASMFPPVPFTFPNGSQLPIGSSVTTSTWSSGRVAPGCYSQPFTLISGTFYFGDLDYYNLSNMRDVIIVN